MAAGLGFKTFTTGEVLTAADTNGYLMQGVLVFASSAARAAAVTSPQEGQYSYLKDTNSTEYYDGAAWVAAATGDVTGVTAGNGISVTSPTGPVPTVAIDTAVTVDKTTAQTLTNKTLTSPALTTPTISTATTNGDLLYGTGSGALTRLGIGSNAQVLTVASGVPSWATPAGGSATFYGCQLYKSVSQSTSNNAYTALTFESEYVDVGGYHSGTSSKIIIPSGKAGTYLFTGQVSYATASSGLRFAAFYKNNSLVATGNSAFGSTTWDTTTGTLIMTLAVGDEIELVARQNSGGSLNVVGEDSDNFITRFGCIYLGA